MTIVMLPLLAFVNMIVGVPTVTDGDSLRIGYTRIRLDGIDAPEIEQ
jgi:endonuclease YncB( thermonuclease family)